MSKSKQLPQQIEAEHQEGFRPKACLSQLALSFADSVLIGEGGQGHTKATAFPHAT